jgi:uncharacterized membrane protein YraQ (UPF0718 family)
MNQLNNGFTIFLSLLVEAMPFLLLGVFLSSLLLLFVDESKLVEKMPKNPLLGALFGSMIGFLFPVCECGNVPVARRLLMQGVPTPVAIGFLLAAPTINPIVIWSTWTAFRDQPEIVVLRVVFSLAIATIIGFIFSFQPDLVPFLQPAIARYLKFNPPAPPKTNRRGQQSQLQPQTNTPNLLQSGTTQVLAPRDLILSLGAGPISSILAMLVLAAVVSICSTVDAFFALSFASTFTSGSLLAFLVFGPMIDIKGIGLMLSIFKPKALIYLFFLAGQLTLLFTLFLNLHVI